MVFIDRNLETKFNFQSSLSYVPHEELLSSESTKFRNLREFAQKNKLALKRGEYYLVGLTRRRKSPSLKMHPLYLDRRTDRFFIDLGGLLAPLPRDYDTYFID